MVALPRRAGRFHRWCEGIALAVEDGVGSVLVCSPTEAESRDLMSRVAEWFRGQCYDVEVTGINRIQVHWTDITFITPPPAPPAGPIKKPAPSPC